MVVLGSWAARGAVVAGDVDGDGEVTVLDLVAVINRVNGKGVLERAGAEFLADMNGDGMIDALDVGLMSDVILGIGRVPEPGLGRVLATSPRIGEVDVSVTRETVFRFNLPLSPTNRFTSSTVTAAVGGRRILTRFSLGSDLRSLTVFYVEPLPGASRVKVRFEGRGMSDMFNRPMDLDGDGAPGGDFTMEFDTLNNRAFPGTVVTGRVFASELVSIHNGVTNIAVNVPLAGVRISVDGNEESLQTFTDSYGNFRLDPAPGGTFFVHIDGTTVTNLTNHIRYPDLSYYPVVGKRWESRIGQGQIAFTSNDLLDVPALARKLQSTSDPIAGYLRVRFPGVQGSFDPSATIPIQLASLLGALNGALEGESIYEAQRFAGVLLADEVRELIARNPQGSELKNLNRLLLESAFPAELAHASGEANVGTIYLPLITQGTLRPVNVTSETVVTFPSEVLARHPELEGVSITVPPNALFGDNGLRGGKIGIAPVPPDRLPSPLPPGLDFPLVITVQSDGPQNFDRPVAACFPNLVKLPPGSKSALWSFNHDSGNWEIRGPMTVSSDGRFVCTDPGVGIESPGWHGTSPGVDLTGGDLVVGGKPDNPHESPRCPAAAAPAGSCPTCKADADKKTDPINYHSGEFSLEVEDLRIPGRGMDFVWSRKYRTGAGQSAISSGQGVLWDFSYNMHLRVSGTNVAVADGNSRLDQYTQQSDGTWTQPGSFKQLIKNVDNSYTLIFEDQGRWNFQEPDPLRSIARIQSIVDRNGNRMSFEYDPHGRLERIIDTLDRPITLTYDRFDLIKTVTDFAGRTIRYEHYRKGDADGDDGDLKSVTSPAVVNTPNGNDFPAGKTLLYTYDQAHNLVSVTDGRRNDPNDPTFGQGPYVVNVYGEPGGTSFEHRPVVRQIWGGGIIDLAYIKLLPSNANGNVVQKTIINDRNGNVLELFYDLGNRQVRKREFTGRAAKGQPTTEYANRPLEKLRSSDPDYFETITVFNEDSLVKQVIHPNGNITEYVYESDLNPEANARTRGNLRTIRRLPGTHQPSGDQDKIEEHFEYDTDHAGCCGFNFVTKHTDPRGNVTRHFYDARGNRTNTVHRLSQIVEDWEYNEFGQLTAHVLPDNGSGHRRRDEMRYYAAGSQRGYVDRHVVDARNLALTTHYEYDAVGNIVRTVDPRGHDSRVVLNALNQVVRSYSREANADGLRYERDYFYDANNNLVRLEVQNVDANGVLQANTHFTTRIEYDVLNYPVRVAREVELNHEVVTEREYDANRNLVLIRSGEAVAGRQPMNVTRTLYDERELPYRVTLGYGDPNRSTTQYDYDLNGNLVRVSQGIEDNPRIARSVFDGFNRLVSVTDAMGNVATVHYDSGGNITNTMLLGELVDGVGGTNNVRLQELSFVYDAMNRSVQTDRAWFDAATQQPIGDGKVTSKLTFSDTSQVLSAEDDNGHRSVVSYDSASRVAIRRDHKGNSITYGYDPNGNVTNVVQLDTSDLGGPEEVFTSRSVYDNLDRQTASTDNIGNQSQAAYDSRNNLTLTLDALTNRVEHVFDGLNRLAETIRFLTQTGGGNSAQVGRVTTRQTWDDASRLTSQIDDNGNATTYVHDALNRTIATVFADGTRETAVYDVHHNPIGMTDGNSNVVNCAFDLLNRQVRKDVVPGPGVSKNTTFEAFQYDGLSRLIHAEDDDSLVTRTYDSLSRIVRETQNGQSVLASFDAVGNRISCTYPSGRQVLTRFDELNRKQEISDADGLIARYWYVGPGRVAQRDFGNGTRTSYQYDGMTGRPNEPGDYGVQQMVRSTHTRSQDNAVVDDRSYRWDGVGNKTRRQDHTVGGAQLRHDYEYDSIYRLNQSTKTDTGGLAESSRYFLDGVGNRTNVVGGPDAGTYALSAVAPEPMDRQMNQYTATPKGSRSHDRNGNLTLADSNERQFIYDFRNRLVAHTNIASGVSSRYAYDALGRRIGKSVRGEAVTAIRYFYLGWQICEEQSGEGDTLASYAYGNYIDEVLETRRGGQRLFYHADQLFNVVATTDAQGTVVERYDYDDYGRPRASDAGGQPIALSAVNSTFLFTGRQFDPEIGLYQYRTRYLDPESGRFTTRDSIGIWGDSRNVGNGFILLANNPLCRRDPYGMDERIKDLPHLPEPDNAKDQDPKLIGLIQIINWIIDHQTSFSIVGEPIAAQGGPNESLSESLGRWAGSKFGGGARMEHVDIYQGGRKILLGGDSTIPTSVPPVESIAKDDLSRRNIYPLTRTDDGELRWGCGKGKPCSQASEAEISDCIRRSPRAVRELYGMSNNNCQHNVQHSLTGCCLAGYKGISPVAPDDENFTEWQTAAEIARDHAEFMSVFKQRPSKPLINNQDPGWRVPKFEWPK